MQLFAPLSVLFSASAAVSVPGDCVRKTHVSRGSAADHLDLGSERVMWGDWWSQEGTATDITVMNCAPGEALKAQTAEETVGRRLPMDRTGDAMAEIARHETGAQVFATLHRFGAESDGIARDVQVTKQSAKNCACAAFFPDLRGHKTEFRLESL